MTTAAVALVVLAAALHASWNLLLKRAHDRLAFIWWTGVTGSAILLPVAGWLAPWPEAGAGLWARTVLAALLRAVYFVTLAAAYGRGDLSLVYPVARGIGPILVAVAAIALLGEHVSGLAGAGIALVAAGVYTMHVPRWGARGWLAPLAGLDSSALRYAALTGAVIAAYSVVDKWNIAAGMPPAWYGYLTIPVAALLLTPIMVGRATRRSEWRGNRGPILVVAVLMTGSYVLVLHALRLAPVSHVAPARELGIVFGTLLGLFVLGERQGRQRLAGALLIVGGVVLLAVMP